ncbi:molybdate ABC transporter substrate-binding protein [Herbaspirillum sp. ST 5-3]|uniref:molybdate ABC transporter substrate-binding protein n=1 Tax=Oxalobacteraceae TaxID=75682 RepID=UPI0010A36B9D|nr:molybdate ABC transporter substrate-binding protein [Herbaspirillum sp. ST 5-3]
MKRVLVLLLASIAALSAHARDVYVAAAADLTFCLKDLNAAFQKANPDVKVIVATGSSGKFFSQIQNSAPFDVFMSADIDYPRKLADAGLAVRESLFQYAVGQIAVWVINPQFDVAKGLAVLSDPRISKIAIANPSHAPYGRAAQAAMEKAKVWESVRPKLVMGENISQAAQFVQTGNASAGIIALSILKAPSVEGIGRYWLIPRDQYPAIEQGAVLTIKGKDNADARNYMAFLKTPDARRIFDRYGFLLPSK